MENPMYDFAMQSEETLPSSAAQNARGKLYWVQIVLCMIGIALGLLCVLNAFVEGVFFGFDYYEYPRYVSAVAFGGDFYTEIHDATSKAANNVADVVDILDNLAGILQVMLGGSTALLFGIMLCNRIEKARDAVRKK